MPGRPSCSTNEATKIPKSHWSHFFNSWHKSKRLYDSEMMSILTPFNGSSEGELCSSCSSLGVIYRQTWYLSPLASSVVRCDWRQSGTHEGNLNSGDPLSA